MFKPHYGPCQYPGCTRTSALLVVKALWCDKCNHKHKQDKKAAAGKKTGSYKYKKESTGELGVFEEVLNNIPDDQLTRCFVCNTRVAVVTPSNMAHVLSKALNKYPKMKLYHKNIVILCHRLIADENGFQGCHHAYDHTPHSHLKGEGWERLFDLREQLKEEYKTYNP